MFVVVPLQGSITGPAIYHFQQVEEARPLFWESLVLAIGLAESFRVAVGWAVPTGNGFNNLKVGSRCAYFIVFSCLARIRPI